MPEVLPAMESGEPLAAPMHLGRRFPDRLRTDALHPSDFRERGVKRQHFEVVEPFHYRSDILDAEVVVPVGFLTDFGSVPAVARWFVDDDSPELLYPSLPHDWLYANGGKLMDGRCVTRKTADRVLREGMQSVGASELKTFIVYWAVRLGGWMHWRSAK